MFSNGGKRNDNKTALIGKQMTSKITRHGNIKQHHSDGQNGICGVYPYLTRLQVAKFALAGGNFVGKTLFIGGTEL